MDWIKKLFVLIFWNPNRFLMRDSAGKIIPDRKRKRHSKLLKDKIKSGEITLGDKPRCLKRQVKGRVSVAKSEVR